MVASNKTQPTTEPVVDFLQTLADPQQKANSRELCQIMSEISGQSAVMWGKSIIGFGHYHYVYKSGREGDAPAISFAPRKDRLVIYLLNGTSNYPKLLAKLGPHQTGKGCLYIKNLAAINSTVLYQLLQETYKYVMTHRFEMGRAT